MVKQECTALVIGNAGVNHPARPSEDIRRLQNKGVRIFAVFGDLEACGIKNGECIEGVQMVHANEIGRLFEDHQQAWHW